MQREDEDRLTQSILALAIKYGRYGYRRVTALLQRGWLASRQGSGRENLAPRRAKSAAEAETAWTVVAQRWIVRAAPAGARAAHMEKGISTSLPISRLVATIPNVAFLYPSPSVHLQYVPQMRVFKGH
jgi:hypothetical protein